MALDAGSVDPGAVSTILNRLKSQGIFDQFRRDCLADVDTKPAYQNLRQRVESFVSNFLSRSRWTPDTNKNQLRDHLRRQINQSDMLASGVDRIIEQVVEPKMQYVFRPQIEKVVSQYLHNDTVNGADNDTRSNGTILPEFPPVNLGDAQPMTPPEDTPAPKVSSLLDHPPLPPISSTGDDKKMPPPPQPPPPPLPPSMNQLSVNVDDPAILPSPAFEPIGSSPPHPGASFLGEPIVESPMPEALSETGSPERMDVDSSPEAEPPKSTTDSASAEVKALLAKIVLAKQALVIESPQTERLSPVSEVKSPDAKEVKKGILKMPKVIEKQTSSPKTKFLDAENAVAVTGSPGSVKPPVSLPQSIRRDKPGDSPGLPSSTPSTPEKTQKSEQERKLEIQRKVENLIKQNIKIRDRRDSSDSSGGDSSPEVRFRGGSSERRRLPTPSPERHRRDYWGHERKKKPRTKQESPPTVRPEDALRAISPEVVSDEELEKKATREVGDIGERSEGELVSSAEEDHKELEPVDLGNLSDITVSSVHTSDLSSFSDVSSSSSTSGSDAEDDKKTKESSGATTNLKSISKRKGKPKGIPPHPDSSEDEATREERKRKAILAKEERVKKRQLEREQKERVRLTATEGKPAQDVLTEKSKIDDDLSPVSTDTDSNKGDIEESPELKEDLGESPGAKESVGESPESKETPVAAKPVAKRRVSEEEKPPVEVFPSFTGSLSQKKRRLATVKDNFLLTQRISGKNLLKRKKKKMNNRSGSKLFFRMSGQSGGNTPKRSASPRMGKPTMPRPDGNLVSSAVDKLKSGVGNSSLAGSLPVKTEDVVIFGKVESQDIGTVRQGQFIPLEADGDAGVGRVGWQTGGTLGPSRGDIWNTGMRKKGLAPEVSQDKHLRARDGTAESMSTQEKESEEVVSTMRAASRESSKNRDLGGEEGLDKQISEREGSLAIETVGLRETIQADEDGGVEEVVVTSEELPRDESSSGPATPLMDEPSDEEMSEEQGEPGELLAEESEGSPGDRRSSEGNATEVTDVEGASHAEHDVPASVCHEPKTEDVSDEEEEDVEGMQASDGEGFKFSRVERHGEADGGDEGTTRTKRHLLGESMTGVEEVSDEEEEIEDVDVPGVIEESAKFKETDDRMPDMGKLETSSEEEAEDDIALSRQQSQESKTILEDVEDVSDDGEEEEEFGEKVIGEAPAGKEAVTQGRTIEVADQLTDEAAVSDADEDFSGNDNDEDVHKEGTDIILGVSDEARSKPADGSSERITDENVRNEITDDNRSDNARYDLEGDHADEKIDPDERKTIPEESEQAAVSSGKADEGIDGHEGALGEKPVTPEDLTVRINEQQTCKVVLQPLQLTPELKAGRSSFVWSSPEDEQTTPEKEDIPVVQGSWVEEIEEGVVQVHDVIGQSAEEYDSPPTPTQDEPVIEDGVVIIEEGGYVQEVTAGDAETQGQGEAERRVTAASDQNTEETQDSHPSEVTHSDDQVFTQDALSGTDTGAIAGRRSRRTVSDRHGKDEDFVYFGVKKKSRPRSQSPTPSLQSNESESSHTSRSSARSSRKNSVRSGAEQEDRKPDQPAPYHRKRHASQELPSTSLAEERPKRARRGSPPRRYSPSESATQRVTKRKQSPPPQDPVQPHSQEPQRTSKREHNTRHSTSSNRDSDFVYDLPKRRSDRHSSDERPSKKKR